MNPSDYKKPIVFFINGLGDHILTLPALRALANIFPSRLSLVCCPGMLELFFSELPLATVVECTVDEATRSFDCYTVASAVGECDLFLSLTPWHSSSLTELLGLLRPKSSVGYFSQFEHRLARDYSKHAADLAFDLPSYFVPSLKLEEYSAPPRLPPAAWAGARSILSWVPSSFRRLAVHVDTTEQKMWYTDRFESALDQFLKNHPEFLVFLVGSGGLSCAGSRYAERIIPTYGVPVAVAFWLVATSHLFLGIDSCMLHVADIFRVPSVGLFGPTSSVEFGCRFAPHRHLCGDGSLDTIQPAAVVDGLENLSVLKGGCIKWG